MRVLAFSKIITNTLPPKGAYGVPAFCSALISAARRNIVLSSSLVKSASFRKCRIAIFVSLFFVPRRSLCRAAQIASL